MINLWSFVLALHSHNFFWQLLRLLLPLAFCSLALEFPALPPMQPVIVALRNLIGLMSNCSRYTDFYFRRQAPRGEIDSAAVSLKPSCNEINSINTGKQMLLFEGLMWYWNVSRTDKDYENNCSWVCQVNLSLTYINIWFIGQSKFCLFIVYTAASIL